MNWISPWLAVEANPADILARSRSWSDPAKRETLLFVGAVAVLVFAILIWAIFIRKPRRRHERHRRHHHHGDHSDAHSDMADSSHEASTEEEAEDDEDEGGSRRRRRRRREHRPRNPTLAETGGLPPLRRDPPAEPPA